MKARVSIFEDKKNSITEIKEINTKNPLKCLIKERGKKQNIKYEEIEIILGNNIPNSSFISINLINSQKLDIEEIKRILDECNIFDEKIREILGKEKIK